MVLDDERCFCGPLRVERRREKKNQVVSKEKSLKLCDSGVRWAAIYCTSWHGRCPSRCRCRRRRQRRDTCLDGGEETIMRKLPGPTPVVAVVQVAGYRASGEPGCGVRRFYTRPKVARPPFTGRPAGWGRPV